MSTVNLKARKLSSQAARKIVRLREGSCPCELLLFDSMLSVYIHWHALTLAYFSTPLAQLINFEDSQVFGIDLSENDVTVLNFLQLFSEIQQLNLLHNNIGMSRVSLPRPSEFGH